MEESIHDRIMKLNKSKNVAKMIKAVYTTLLHRSTERVMPPAFIFTRAGAIMIKKLLDEETYPLIITVYNTVCTMDSKLIGDLYSSHLKQQRVITQLPENATPDEYFYPEVLAAQPALPAQKWLVEVYSVVLLACYFDLLTGE